MTGVTHLGFIIEDSVRLRPGAPALLQDDLVISYGELDERSNRVAGWLAAAGVAPAQRVALLWSNDVGYVESFLGVIRAGGVVVPLNVRQRDDVLAYVLKDSGAVGILASPDLAAQAQALARSGDDVRFVAGPDDLAAADPLQTFPRHSPDDVCMQPYTSGSTGRPKGVLLSHRGALWNADVVGKCHLLDETERALLVAPLFHKNSGVTLKAFLLAGASCVILPGFDTGKIIEAIDHYRITYLGGVPAMFRMLLSDREALAGHDVSSVRFAVAGSAVVQSDLLEAFTRTFGAPIAEGYGLTEGGPDVILSPRWGLRKTGSLGIALPGCETRLARLDDETADVGVGEVGELWARNPGVTLGYHNLPDVTAERIRDGWLATRDLMYQDTDGFFYYVGRRDDLINVGGENVYPKEVEEILLQHAGVADVAVVAAPHEVRGQVPVAFVVRAAGSTVTSEELVAHFHELGPHYAYPRVVTFLDALPLAGTGKTDRATLTAAAAEAAGR